MQPVFIGPLLVARPVDNRSGPKPVAQPVPTGCDRSFVRLMEARMVLLYVVNRDLNCILLLVILLYDNANRLDKFQA